MSALLRLFPAATLLAVLAAASPAAAELERPTLERYAFDIGQSHGYELSFTDPRLGNGGAFFRLDLQARGSHRLDLRLEIGRHVPPDTITFALLVSGIELRFLDATGAVVEEVVLEGDSLWPGGYFVIGDSADGYFQHRQSLANLARVRRVNIALFGNYE